MSNMRLVIINPPEILIEDINVAMAASDVAVLLGSSPPPIITRPPAAVIPEIALVTDMRGECRAGVTPHTTLYPITPARENVVTIVAKAGFGDTKPRPITLESTAVNNRRKITMRYIYQINRSASSIYVGSIVEKLRLNLK